MQGSNEPHQWSGAGPDGRPRADILKRVTAAVVEAVAPERIVLYGSGARGEMTEDSDIDLLVVVETDHPNRIARLAEESVDEESCILQPMVATEADLKARAHKPYDVLYAALDEGVTLHDARPPDERATGPRHGGISPGERLHDAGNWLRAAARGLELTENPTRLRGTVCEESSRSVRFSLKAAAIAAGGCHHTQRNIQALRLEVARLGIEPCINGSLAAELDKYKTWGRGSHGINTATCERLALAAHCAVAQAASVIGVEAPDLETLMHGPDAAAEAVIDAAVRAAAQGAHACAGAETGQGRRSHEGQDTSSHAG